MANPSSPLCASRPTTSRDEGLSTLLRGNLLMPPVSQHTAQRYTEACDPNPYTLEDYALGLPLKHSSQQDTSRRYAKEPGAYHCVSEAEA